MPSSENAETVRLITDKYYEQLPEGFDLWSLRNDFTSALDAKDAEKEQLVQISSKVAKDRAELIGLKHVLQSRNQSLEAENKELREALEKIAEIEDSGEWAGKLAKAALKANRGEGR